MTLKKIRSIIFYFSFLVLAGGFGFWAGQREIAVKWEKAKPEVLIVNKAVPSEKKDIDFSLFWEVWNKLEKEYLDPNALNREKMFYGAISGMTAALGDPYTVFLPPQKQTETKEELSGEFSGVGIQLGFKNDRLTVIAPLDGTPAKSSGILAGDLILHIKDDKKGINRDTEGMALPEAVEIIRGPKGQPVTLTLVRETKEPFEVTIIRDTILVKSVTVEFINGPDILSSDSSSTVPPGRASGRRHRPSSTVAYIRLSRFGDRTIPEWNDAVQKIIKQANQDEALFGGVVLDIRNNPGGYLDAAVTIGSEFFPDGVIVEQKGKSESHPFNVVKPGKLTDVPVVVLVNKGSASASEIVAGAIQARNRGKLVGENTFGKGTVQDAQDLTGGAGLHITTARWLLPNGNWIHDEGLKPDIEVEYDQEASKDQKWDNQVKAAINELLSSRAK